MRISNGLAPGTPTDPPGHWFPIFQFGATIGAFLLFVVYLLIALTGFKGQPGENRAGLALAGLLAGATSVAALYGVVYKAPSIYWFDKVWWLALIWVVIGVGVVAGREVARQPRLARARRPRLGPHDTGVGHASSAGLTPIVHAVSAEAHRRQRDALRAGDEVVDRHVLVGRVGAVDVARAEADGGDAGLDRERGAVVPVVEAAELLRLAEVARRAASSVCTIGSSVGDLGRRHAADAPLDLGRVLAQPRVGRGRARRSSPRTRARRARRSRARRRGRAGTRCGTRACTRPGRRRATRRPR